MDEIIKFLKSMGLGDQEIQKVLKEVPVEQTGLMGTNVATGVFLKGGKKEMSQLPLIVEKITNPFEVNFYKNKPRDEAIKTAEAGIKYLDEELKKTADLILNKNLQLTQEQKINFAKNLETKRKFEKDLENFKTKPEAEVLDIKTKGKVEDVEKLKEEAGQVNAPGTLMGDIETRVNRLKNLVKEEGITMQDVIGDFASGQKGMLKLRDEGLVRSTARQIMFNDIKSGKLKASKEIQDIVSGKTSGDPIDSFRTIYGEDALEQLDSLIPDLRQLKTEIEAEKLARSKFEFMPKLDRPKESYTSEEMEKILKNEEPEKFAKGGLGYLMGE